MKKTLSCTSYDERFFKKFIVRSTFERLLGKNYKNEEDAFVSASWRTTKGLRKV